MLKLKELTLLLNCRRLLKAVGCPHWSSPIRPPSAISTFVPPSAISRKRNPNSFSSARVRNLSRCFVKRSAVLFFEVRDAIVVRVVDGRRVTVHRSGLVELLGLISCERTGLSHIARFNGIRAEVLLTRAFGSGGARQEMWTGTWSRSDRQGTARKTDENMRMERVRWRDMTCALQTPLSHASARGLYATQGKCVRKMCVRHGVCVHLSVAHTVLATTWVRNPESKKKIIRLRHSMSILISPTRTLSTNLLSTDHHECMLLGFPRHAFLRDLQNLLDYTLGFPRHAEQNTIRIFHFLSSQVHT